LTFCFVSRIPYKVEKIDIKKDVQKEPYVSYQPAAETRIRKESDHNGINSRWFLEINPNGRIPALTDTFTDGKQIRLFESGSILQYLADQYDKDFKISYPRGTREYYEMNNWLFFQNAGVGPMQGQANHFNRYAPERIEYGVNRYINETRRLYGVLDKHLATCKSGYLVGDHVSIADISHWGWIAHAAWAGVDIDEFPHLKAWDERMFSRPGVEKGRHVPDPHTIKDLMKDKEALEKSAAEARSWIQRGMAADAKK
jgi:glutathione S-transferase